jgi:hypothetical protein
MYSADGQKEEDDDGGICGAHSRKMKGIPNLEEEKIQFCRKPTRQAYYAVT